MRSSAPSLGLEIDVLRRTVRVGGTPIDLTAVEFGILAALARDPGGIVTSTALLDLVWGPEFTGEDHRIDSHAASLRWKLGDDGDRRALVELVAGLGYRLVTSP